MRRGPWHEALVEDIGNCCCYWKRWRKRGGDGPGDLDFREEQEAKSWCRREGGGLETIDNGPRHLERGQKDPWLIRRWLTPSIQKARRMDDEIRERERTTAKEAGPSGRRRRRESESENWQTHGR